MDAIGYLGRWEMVGSAPEVGMHTRGHHWGSRVWSRRAILLGYSRRLRWIAAGDLGVSTWLCEDIGTASIVMALLLVGSSVVWVAW